MDEIEALLRELSRVVSEQHPDACNEEAVVLDKPFERLPMKNAVLRYNDDDRARGSGRRRSVAGGGRAAGVKGEDSWGAGKWLTELFEATVEHQLTEPTFVTDYPAEVSPLARRRDDDPSVTERFELFIAGREVANGFSELNDAEDQAERFRAQAAAKDAGDDEAMYYDADYIAALEYGLPPTGGAGIGIDRVVMMLTGASAIRDVLLFPQLRPQKSS